MRRFRSCTHLLLLLALAGVTALGCDTTGEEEAPGLGGRWEGQAQEGIQTFTLVLNLSLDGIDISGNGTLQIADLGPGIQVLVVAEGTYEYPSVEIAITGDDGSLRFLNAQMDEDGSSFSGTLREATGSDPELEITMTR